MEDGLFYGWMTWSMQLIVLPRRWQYLLAPVIHMNATVYIETAQKANTKLILDFRTSTVLFGKKLLVQ